MYPPSWVTIIYRTVIRLTRHTTRVEHKLEHGLCSRGLYYFTLQVPEKTDVSVKHHYTLRHPRYHERPCC